VDFNNTMYPLPEQAIDLLIRRRWRWQRVLLS